MPSRCRWLRSFWRGQGRSKAGDVPQSCLRQSDGFRRQGRGRRRRYRRKTLAAVRSRTPVWSQGLFAAAHHQARDPKISGENWGSNAIDEGPAWSTTARPPISPAPVHAPTSLLRDTCQQGHPHVYQSLSQPVLVTRRDAGDFVDYRHLLRGCGQADWASRCSTPARFRISKARRLCDVLTSDFWQICPHGIDARPATSSTPRRRSEGDLSGKDPPGGFQATCQRRLNRAHVRSLVTAPRLKRKSGRRRAEAPAAPHGGGVA